MLKYKSGTSYVPANEVEIERYDCPVKVGSSNNGSFMKVINGVWAVSVLPYLIVEEPHLIFIGLVTTVDGISFKLPTELNMTVSNHTLKEA